MIDIVFIILLFLALIKGMRKGFVLSIFSFAAIFIGLAAALKLSAVMALKLHAATNIAERWLPFLSFIIVIAAVSIVVRFIARMIEKTLNMTSLGLLNKLAGFVLFVILYMLIYSIVLFYLTKMNVLKEDTVASSFVYPYIEPLGPKVIAALGELIPLFKDLFIQLENFFSSVAQKAGSA